MSSIISHDKILCKSFRKKISPQEKETLYNISLSIKNQIPIENETQLRGKVTAVFDKLKIWTGRTSITVGFLPFKNNPKNTALGLDQRESDTSPVGEGERSDTTPEDWRMAWTCWVVKTYIQPYIGMQLDFTMDLSEGLNCDVRITFDPDLGSYSLIGTDCLDRNAGYYRESTNIGWIDAPRGFKFTYDSQEYTIPPDGQHLTGGGGVSGGTIIHEFGHVLGMIHEHQSPFGTPFYWNRDRVISIFSGPPNYWSQDTITENFFVEYNDNGIYNGSNFDPSSIMKYSFGDGTQILDRSKYNTVDKYINAIDYLEKVNTNLSPLDKYWLQKKYPGGSAPPVNKPSDAIDYDQKLSWWKKSEFYIRNLDESTKKIIVKFLVILLIISFIYDFFNFFKRKRKENYGHSNPKRT